jgi:hypothetical protein
MSAQVIATSKENFKLYSFCNIVLILLQEIPCAIFLNIKRHIRKKKIPS